jgi:hypothetical protein
MTVMVPTSCFRSVSCLRHTISSWWTYLPSYFRIPPIMTELWSRQVVIDKCFSHWPIMVLAWDILSHHGEHLCQVLLKSPPLMTELWSRRALSWQTHSFTPNCHCGDYVKLTASSPSKIVIHHFAHLMKFTLLFIKIYPDPKHWMTSKFRKFICLACRLYYRKMLRKDKKNKKNNNF